MLITSPRYGLLTEISIRIISPWWPEENKETIFWHPPYQNRELDFSAIGSICITAKVVRDKNRLGEEIYARQTVCGF